MKENETELGNRSRYLSGQYQVEHKLRKKSNQVSCLISNKLVPFLAHWENEIGINMQGGTTWFLLLHILKQPVVAWEQTENYKMQYWL
jgi:hypothetical protein